MKYEKYLLNEKHNKTINVIEFVTVNDSGALASKLTLDTLKFELKFQRQIQSSEIVVIFHCVECKVKFWNSIQKP